MADTPGKKEIKAEMKLHPMKEMSAKARDFISSDPELKKMFQKAVTWDKKGEFDPRKHNKKSLDEDLLADARMPFKIFANRVDKAAGEKDGDRKKLVKELMKDFAEAVKGAINNASLKFEEIESGKGDNKKALKDGKAAFAKLSKIDFGPAFAGPHQEITDVLAELKVALKAKGADSARAFDKARKAAKKVDDDFDKAGREAAAAIDFVIKTARAIKNDTKADSALVEFGKLVLKDAAVFDDFVKQSNDFAKAVESAVKLLDSNSAEVGDVEKLIKEVAATSSLVSSAEDVEELADELEPRFKDIERLLK